MSAETLRRAAALMRERADVPLAGPWHVDPADHDFDPYHGGPHVRYTKADGSYSCSIAYGVWPENVEHIASWHPAVALAVADWLDDAAENLDMQAPSGELRKNWDMRVHINGDKALAVARAYLGESA